MGTKQSKTEQRQRQPSVSWLLARHLEVFVPKPKTRELENALLRSLDNLLDKEELPLRKREPNDLANYTERARKLLTNHSFWENIIYGYSTYETDGAFLDRKEHLRKSNKYYKEQTLVLKFILTNYRTGVDVGRARFFDLEGMLLREGKIPVSDDRLTELMCAESHYSDICDFIVDHIVRDVLDGEIEVWSQEWLTMLNRWQPVSRKEPIVKSKKDRERRFLHNHSVLCTVDYCARTPRLSSRRLV